MAQGRAAAVGRKAAGERLVVLSACLSLSSPPPLVFRPAEFRISLPSRRVRIQPNSKWETDEDCFYQHPALGAGEGILLQHVPVPAAEDRDSHVPESVREASENLVPKQEGEAQERRQRHPAKLARGLQVQHQPGALPPVGG